MKLGERKSQKKKFIVTALLLSAFVLTPSFSYSAETQTASAKTPMIKSLANKIKTKFNKKEKIKAQENKNADTQVATVKGQIELSIEDCVDYALKHDLNIKNYADTQKAQKSSVGIAKSNYFPSIYGGTGYNISRTKYSGDFSESMDSNYYGLNMGVNALIWDFGRTTARINMNKYNYEASGYDLSNVILNSIYNVKIKYTQVLAARANEDIYTRSVKINELNVQRTKAMYEVGLKSKIDLVDAEVTLTEARISLLQAQNDYQSALIYLNNAMYYVNAPDYSIKDTETFNFQKNYSVKNEINVAFDRKNYDPNGVDAEIKDGAILTSGIEKRDILKTYRFKPFELSMADAIAKAYENRPDLKSLELVKRASEESLKVIKRSYYPSLNASAGYSYQKRTEYASNAVGIYAGIDLPTINGMSIKYQIDQGKSYLDIALNNVDLMKKNIYFQVQYYYVNMKQLEKRIPLKSLRIAQALEKFELADGRYAVGIGDYIHLQNAQTDYNNAQLDFVKSVFEYNEARFNLEKTMGAR